MIFTMNYETINSTPTESRNNIPYGTNYRLWSDKLRTYYAKASVH